MSKSFSKITLSPILLAGALLLGNLAFNTGCATQRADESMPEAEKPEGAGEYNYAKLQTRSLDDMNAVARRQIAKAKKFNNEDDPDSAIAALQAAAQFTLSRPDRDNAVTKVIAPIRTELKEMNVMEATMHKIVMTSIAGLNNKSLKPSDRATYYFVLINFMSEFKPDLKTNPKMRQSFEEIKKADIEIDHKVMNDLALRAMSGRAKSPSEVATNLLKSVKTKALKSEGPPDDLESAP